MTAGASGHLAQQIGQGLPVDLFLSADEDFAKRLADSGWAGDPGVVYASGRLALVVAAGTAIPVDGGLRGLRSAWPQARKFAIANPLLAPYGVAAEQALRSVALWESVQPKLVLGANVAQAAQFVATGSAQAGLTALSLLVGRAAGTAPVWGGYVEVDAGLYRPLRQRMVLRRNAPQAAVALYAWLQTAAARALFRQHGFGLP
jgi:molybdate transport system substrate-binding protein